MGLFDKLKNVFKKDKDVEIYDKGLEKTRNEFNNSFKLLSKNHKKITEEYFEELEEKLIMADIGVETVMKLIDKLRYRVKHENITDVENLTEIIIDEMMIIYINNEVIVNKINFSEEGPTVILFVGVNGVGKTTTIGKIAQKLKEKNKKVLLVAGDTFRAGATEQLIEWGNKVDTKVIYKENADPSSVIYDGITEAKNNNYDVVLIDTAGRLQNKVN